MLDETWISETEAAELLGVSRQTLTRWQVARASAPPCYPLGSRRRYKRAEVLAWLDAQRSTPAAPGAA